MIEMKRKAKQPGRRRDPIESLRINLQSMSPFEISTLYGNTFSEDEADATSTRQMIEQMLQLAKTDTSPFEHLTKSSKSVNKWSFLQAVRKARMQRDDSDVKKYYAVHKTAMAENSGVTGGYTVPLDYSMLIMQSLFEHSFLWPRCRVVPMNSAETYCPKPNWETARSAGISPFFGGINFTWQSTEGTAVPDATSTNPFGQLSLKAWDLLGDLAISNQFLMDMGPEAEQSISMLLGEAAAWTTEYAFFRGLGASSLQPTGIVNAPATIALTRAATGHIGSSDAASMVAKLLPYSWMHSIWACSPTALSDVMQMDGFQKNVHPTGIEQHGCAGSLLTRPIFVTDKLPALGTKGDIVLLDPTLYAIGNRQELQIDISPHPLFRNNQSVIRVWLRCDGKPVLDSSVTLADGSSTASGFVVLNT